ncbi:hypothetical protein BGX23_005889 [Mortierella sp. AD031]|nr:hypothetical protein BGX23_005889 [Mortierella sp. AD031]
MDDSGPCRSYCCGYIPYRIGVLIISLIAAAFGGYTLAIMANDTKSTSSSKVGGYIGGSIYLLLAFFGILSVAFKIYPLVKNFSVLWWGATVLTTILNTLTIILLATSAKDFARDACYNAQVEAFDYYDAKVLELDVDACYKNWMVVVGVSMGVEALIMCLCGFVASRYTSEVKHMYDHENHPEYQVQDAYPKA